VVYLITIKTDVHFVFNNVLLGTLGTVLGFVISFRTSSAYEGYQDGRKMWMRVAAQCRNVAQLVCVVIQCPYVLYFDNH
jgi:ion channel-forming bestrophin family protein